MSTYDRNMHHNYYGSLTKHHKRYKKKLTIAEIGAFGPLDWTYGRIHDWLDSGCYRHPIWELYNSTGLADTKICFMNIVSLIPMFPELDSGLMNFVSSFQCILICP